MSLTLRPLSGVASVAAHAGLDLERAAAERALDSPQFERLLSSAINSDRLAAAIVRIFEGAAAKRLVDGFFDSGLFDEFVSHLLESEALWELVDRVADSPAVTAAITQQGFGFADQVGEEVRARSRRADDWLERAAHRMPGRRRKDFRLRGEDLGPATP